MSASKRHDPSTWVHGGSGTTYAHYKCRCEECRAANNSRTLRRRGERKPEDNPNPKHGTAAMYKNWNCRCDPCTVENTRANRHNVLAYQSRKKAKG